MMIKFNKEPKLNDKEKKYVIKRLKPLLKQNKTMEVRDMLFEDSNHILSDDEYDSIAYFLLYHLQDDYFRDSDEIFWNEFMNMQGILSISIPNWITRIDGSAFSGCENLKDVTIPNSVTKIDMEAFHETALKRVVIPKGCDVSYDAFDEGVEIIIK